MSSSVEKAAELHDAYLAHVDEHGYASAMTVLEKFCDEPPASWASVPDDRMDDAIAALKGNATEPQAHGRKPMRSAEEQQAGLNAMAPKVYARWNASRRPKPNVGA